MKSNKTAISANQLVHNEMDDGEYASLAPHLCHASIRSRYLALVDYVYSIASSGKDVPFVLDLGAGDGTATIPFLERGARVLAVDISEQQLKQLRDKCDKYGARLQSRMEEMAVVLREGHKFDLIIMNSVLHHIPDYMEVLRLVVQSLNQGGLFMSFQDPMWATSIPARNRLLSNAAYFCWRVRRGDVLAGLWRRLKRMVGVYSEDSPYDNSEYHAVRDGVNQIAIRDMFVAAGLDCRVVEYCSFHSAMLQPLGERLGVYNTFAVVAGCELPNFPIK